LTNRRKQRTANTGLAKVAVLSSAYQPRLMVNQTLTLRINTCLPAGRCVVEIRHYAKRQNVMRQLKDECLT